MAESGVREIQLSGKQLVFLFMASVVLVVVVFLLGVSVGRGARTPIGPVNEASVSGPEAPQPPSPATKATPTGLDYDKGLKGSDASAKPAEGTPAQDPPSTASATKAATPATPPPPPPTTPPAKTPAVVTPVQPPKPTPAPAATKTAATAPAGWFVQVDSFRSKDLADALVAKLKSKGFETVLLDEPKPLLRVRVGPYAQQSAAAAAASQLKKDGFSPSLYVTR